MTCSRSSCPLESCANTFVHQLEHLCGEIPELGYSKEDSVPRGSGSSALSLSVKLASAPTPSSTRDAWLYLCMAFGEGRGRLEPCASQLFPLCDHRTAQRRKGLLGTHSFRDLNLRGQLAPRLWAKVGQHVLGEGPRAGEGPGRVRKQRERRCKGDTGQVQVAQGPPPPATPHPSSVTTPPFKLSGPIRSQLTVQSRHL